MWPLVLLGLIGPTRAGEPPEGAWVWGDLHAHSGWSHDGCEDAEADCAPRATTPAEDFFAEAEAADLDFAALTDHAEAGSWLPEGEGGPSYEVWSGQAGAVEAARGGVVLPVLGYEWTAYRDDEKRGHPRGTHRTVLLGSAEPCDARRVPGFVYADLVHTGSDGRATWTQSEVEPVDRVADLWEALDGAEERCGPTRWVSFAHHPAYALPQATDWGLRENRPDRETLVEIASEHGSSECLDLGAEGCDWRVNEAQGYLPEGSVQAALDRGYTLGFVGGTDAHDARPGSLSDGPGAVGQIEDGAIRRHFAPGAITGVFLEGDLDLDSLFDALEDRRTLASTGPRPELRAWAEGADGLTYLPGEALPRAALPARLFLEAAEAEGYALSAIERLGPGGLIEDRSDGPDYEGAWDASPGDWTYLRLRYASDSAEDGEERVWLSPWFVERRCGCGSGAPASLLATALATALAAARRQRSAHR